MAEQTLFEFAILGKMDESAALRDYATLSNNPGVYCIYNSVSRKFYVGSTVNVRTRIRQHYAELRYKRHYNDILQLSFESHGEEVFKVACLEQCDRHNLIVREQVWIEATRCTDRAYGYNLNPRADRTFLSTETKRKMGEARRGFRHSPETLLRMSAAQRGRKATEETKIKLSQSHLGHHHTDEAKRKIGEAAKGNKYSLGRKRSEAECKRISEFMRGPGHPTRGRRGASSPLFGIPLSPEHRAKVTAAVSRGRIISHERRKKPVSQVDPVTKRVIASFGSVKEASQRTGILAQSIAAVCRNRGERRSAGGFGWEYISASVQIPDPSAP